MDLPGNLLLSNCCAESCNVQSSRRRILALALLSLVNRCAAFSRCLGSRPPDVLFPPSSRGFSDYYSSWLLSFRLYSSLAFVSCPEEHPATSIPSVSVSSLISPSPFVRTSPPASTFSTSSAKFPPSLNRYPHHGKTTSGPAIKHTLIN